MKNKSVQIIISLFVAAIFLWIAFRDVNFSDLGEQLKMVTFYWLPFFIITLTFSHYLRAERWKLLLPEQNDTNRSTLYAGVMLGYMMNNLLPRLGEISRPVYVAKKEKISTGNLVGTIVAERFFDLLVMGLLVVVAVFMYTGDSVVIERIFGVSQWEWFHYLIIPFAIIIVALLIWLFHRIVTNINEKGNITNPLLSKWITTIRSFSEGMVSLRRVRNWPLFLLLTAGIWFGYVLMTYIPFYMLDLQDVFGLGLLDAVVLTIVSAIGVSVPTPGAIGSYHLLIQQSMWMLFNVELATALTFATVLHAVNILIVFIIGALSLWWDKFYRLTHDIDR